jgi:hypothetical protein
MSNNHVMEINKQYASWLNTYKWNYFITLRSNYKYNYMTVRTWMKNLFNKQTSVTRVFFATERDKGDWTSNHTHVLISSKKTITYSELKKTFSCSVGDYQIINDNEGVTKYVTKFMGKNVDYDFKGDFLN